MEKKKELPNYQDYWFYVVKGRPYTKYLEDLDNRNKNFSVSKNFNEVVWEQKLLKYHQKNNIKTIIDLSPNDHSDDDNNNNDNNQG